MALIRVREKHPADGAQPLTTYVDEAWIERWPDDFDAVPEPAPEAVPAAEATDPAAADAPATEPSVRGRF